MDDSQFLAGFEDRTLTEFHHRDHVRLTWLYLRRHGFEGAARRISKALQALAAAHGASAKYNETLTLFWIRLVEAAMAPDTATDFEAFITAHPALLDKQLPQRFYRPETLASPQARAGWIAPDLAGAPDLRAAAQGQG